MYYTGKLTLGHLDEMWQRGTAVFELQVVCANMRLRSPIKEAEVSPFFCWRRLVNTSADAGGGTWCPRHGLKMVYR